MAVGIDDLIVAASSEVSEVAGSSTSVEIAGDGIGEKSLGEGLDGSIEMPFGPSEQQSIDGDGIGEGTNDAATSEVSEVSSPSANTEGAEDGFGEGLDNSVEMPFDSFEQANVEIKKEGVTEEKRTELKSKGYSDEVMDQMSSDEEAGVYEQADLIEGEVNGKKCLQKKDIDPVLKDEFGKTNRERMEMGRPPIDKNGEIIELHHVGQKADSPLAELSTTEHRGKGNYGILHDTTKDSEIHTSENEAKWKKEREEYWKERAKDFK